MIRALVVSFILAACAASAPPLSMERPSGAWVLERMEGAPSGEFERPTITFEGDRISGFAGCNRYFGRRPTDPSVETYFAGIGATKMACMNGPAMEVERVFLAGLERARDVRVVEGKLVLFDVSDNEIMRFAPEPSQQPKGGE